MKILFFILFAFPVFACEESNVAPVMKKKLADYDRFVVSLQSDKEPFKSINKRIKTHGLLLDAYIREDLVKKYPSRISNDSITEAHSIFLRNLKLPPGLTNDLVYEITNKNSVKIVRTWQLPANSTFLGIRGNEILHRTFLGSPCGQIHRDVTLGISPNGKFRALPDMKLPRPKLHLNCPAVKAIYKNSGFGDCMELVDIKTRKKRIIVYQSPMT
ncbi:MAG: hypothetical protein ACJ76H_09685 [Bacteriovoracaceae bacterium]